MLSCNVLCKELESRGIFAQKKNLNLDSDKIADQILGLLINTGDVTNSVSFPIDGLLEQAVSVENAADIIQSALDQTKLPDFVDYSYFLKKDYILSHVQYSFIERLWHPFITRDSVFDGILEYCYIAGINRKVRWMIEIREELLKTLEITVDEVWEAAKRNTYKTDFEFVLRSSAEIIGEQSKKLQQAADNSPIQYIYSVSNRFGLQGAVQVLNPKLKDYFDKFDTDEIIMYPQSENNCLIAPAFLKETLKSIAENDQGYNNLSDNLYIMNKELKVQEVIPYEHVDTGEMLWRPT